MDYSTDLFLIGINALIAVTTVPIPQVIKGQIKSLPKFYILFSFMRFCYTAGSVAAADILLASFVWPLIEKSVARDTFLANFLIRAVILSALVFISSFIYKKYGTAELERRFRRNIGVDIDQDVLRPETKEVENKYLSVLLLEPIILTAIQVSLAFMISVLVFILAVALNIY